MIEMLTGTHPWPDINDNLAIIYKLIHLKHTDMPEFSLEENASDNLRDFLKLTFKVEYAERPWSEQLLAHDFLK